MGEGKSADAFRTSSVGAVQLAMFPDRGPQCFQSRIRFL